MRICGSDGAGLGLWAELTLISFTRLSEPLSDADTSDSLTLPGDLENCCSAAWLLESKVVSLASDVSWLRGEFLGSSAACSELSEGAYLGEILLSSSPHRRPAVTYRHCDCFRTQKEHAGF